METNTFIFLFSLVIFMVGFVSFHLTSKDFSKMEDGKFVGGPETGPRADLFNYLYDLLSDDDEWAEKLRNADESEIKEIVRKMNEARKKE